MNNSKRSQQILKYQESKFEMTHTRDIPNARNTTCGLCNKTTNRLVRHHKIPISLGGIFYGCNLLWVCKPCGRAKETCLPNKDVIMEVHKSTLKALEQLSISMEEYFQYSKEKFFSETKQNNTVIDFDLYKEIIGSIKNSSVKTFKYSFETFSNFEKLLRTMI